VDAPETARSVTAVFPWETAHLRWDALRQRWYHRFLVPRDVPEQEIEVLIVIELADGQIEKRHESLVIDATAPELDVDISHMGGLTIVQVRADEPFRSIQVQPTGKPSHRMRRDLALAEDQDTIVFHIPGHWTTVDVIAKDRAMNTLFIEAVSAEE